MTTPVPCSARAGLLSEGPRWDGEREELLWVDIIGSRLHRARIGADGMLDEIAVIELDRHVGAAAPAHTGGYVVAAGAGFLFADPSGHIVELAQPAAKDGSVRMNDGVCDPQGRFWAGTMAYDESPGAGTLYRLELDGTCSTVLTGLTVSNGIGWSPDGTTMYLADSGMGTIDAFDFDPPSGSIDHTRTIVRSTEAGVVPDGLTVDVNGDLWVALWNGAAVQRYAPDGSPCETIRLPVDRPTSCAFGGPDRATLFITTAREGLDDEALQRQPDAGRLFRVDGLNTRGEPCTPYRGNTGSGPGPGP
jgi:sugar lactone lactonase YvrE